MIFAIRELFVSTLFCHMEVVCMLFRHTVSYLYLYVISSHGKLFGCPLATREAVCKLLRYKGSCMEVQIFSYRLSYLGLESISFLLIPSLQSLTLNPSS